MALNIDLTPGDEYWKLTLQGELDYGECAAFRMNIDRILKATPAATIVDMSELDYMDSSGLGLLLSLSKEYSNEGGRLILVTNDVVDNILSLTRLKGVFSTSGSLKDAEELVGDIRV